jgi:hypothetical protein
MQTQTQTPKYQGDPSIEALANGLGTLGRYGDEYMVHAAHGETVIPAEIFESNPELKQQLFQQMRLMGIKDPNRYVVGNSLNSINPLTGQPEFFFKKIFRAIRKVIKKVAPIVVPMLGNMILPGIGGPLASAMMTKMQGGSWGDALKGAALSYGMSALGSGVKGIMNAGKGQAMSGFFTGLKDGAMAPFQAASNLFSSGANNPLAQGIFGPRGMNLAFSSLQGTGAGQIPNSFSAPDAGFFRRAFDTMTPTYNANMAGPSTTGSGQYKNVMSNEKAVLMPNADQPGFGKFEGATVVPKTDMTAYPSGQTTSGGFDNAGRGTGSTSADTGNLGEQFKVENSTLGNKTAYVNTDGGAAGAGETSYLDRKLGVKAADVVREQAGNLVIPAITAGAAYLMQDDEDIPEGDDPRISGQTNAQQKAWADYNAQRGRPDYATWSRSAEAKQLMLDSGIFPSTTDASQLATTTGITQDQAQNYLNDQYAPFVNPLPTTNQVASNQQQVYNQGGIAGFARGGPMLPLGNNNAVGMTESVDMTGPGGTEDVSFSEYANTGGGETLSEANTRVHSGGGGMFIHEGVTYVSGNPNPTAMTDTMTADVTATSGIPAAPVDTPPNITSSGNMFGGSGVMQPDPNFTPSPEDFSSPMMQQLARHFADQNKNQNAPMSPLQQLNTPADIQNSGLFRQNPNQGPSKTIGGQPQQIYNGRPMILAANGGEVEGPGTGTSDSIPANLSDGEFVMTAEAVRNAGGGDRNMGAARMYDLMNRFEGGRA